MATLRVLLVDDDAWTESIVAGLLHKRGHTVAVAHSGEEARRLAEESPPGLIITDAVLLCGEELGKTLFAAANQGKWREAATLLLTALEPQDERVRALPADGFLSKPFRFVDLDRAVERTLQFQKRRLAEIAPEVTGSPVGTGFHGTLDQLGLSSLLTMIEMERKSGILLLRRGNQSARLYCRDGRVVVARLYGAPPAPGATTGAEVVYRLLRWTDGHFNFTAMPVSVSDEIGLRTTHLLLEGARRNDEART